ncbi:DUF3572 domain-containing protein [Roseobacter sp. HKCCA0434]|uniref:DUF3572 domain-containing protein n=1 Tax=Roseobacter sp. HKCCA0434 TaxID=3079297 RepID=UPI002905BCF7|nr:DUF3572 domain-containing protein [Roseobacter sp. HKCCA0434]
MKTDAAKALAQDVLLWLAADEEALVAFLGWSGADPAELRARSDDPDFPGFLLDFLLQDERALVAFCDRNGLAYDMPMRARAALPGGGDVHWT